MQTNVFLGGNADPLLGNVNPYTATQNDYDAKIAELQAMQQRLEQQKQQSNYSKKLNSFQNGNSSPIWDEIEKITSELSDREFELINNSSEYQESQSAIMAILNREYMRLMRPIVESTTDGQNALKTHLELLKRLRKEATREVDKNIELFNEYTQHYSDMTYSEFLKMKKSNNKKK